MSSQNGPPKPPTSISANVSWMVQGAKGPQLGPMSTEAVMKMISDGRIQGSEKIRALPNGRWIPISRQAEFYDRLLEVLEEVVRSKGSKLPPVIAEMPSHNAPEIDERFEEDTLPPRNDELTLAPLRLTKDTSAPPLQKEHSITYRPSNDGEVVDLIRLPEKKAKSDRKMIIPIMMIGLALALALYAFITPDPTDSAGGKPHLLSPRISAGSNGLTNDKVKELLRLGIDSFLLDTYEGYLESQQKLVQLIEGSSQNKEARGLLCLVYRELWPFVRQDSQDLEAVNSLTRTTRQADPVGINGIYCDISRLIIIGRYREAKGVLDHSLNQTNLSSAPVLYALKAELLAGDRDPHTAALYAEKARKLWPEWTKPIFDFAMYSAKAGDYQKAFSALREVRESNPKHKKAAIELGLMQENVYHQTDQAMSTLSAALIMREKVLNSTESRGYLVLAQILVKKKQTKKALEYAQKAYDLNPSDPITKELFKSLGGSEADAKSPSFTAELVYLGDQYVRTGDCLAAQAEFKAAFELDPTNGVAAMKAAKCLWQLNQNHEAVSYLDKAISADKQLTAAYVLQADYFSQRFNYNAAIQILAKAAQRFSNNYEVLRGYGLLEYRRNNLKEALAYLLRAHKIYENDTDTLILLARVQMGLTLYKEASVSASRAVEVDSTNSEAQIVFAKVIGQLYGVDQGIARLRELMVKYAYTVDFRVGLAELYASSERFKISQEIYEQIVEVDPKNKKAWIGLGASYQAQGLFDKAIKSTLSAAILDPTDPEPLYKLGLIYLENDKYKDAITQFQRALKINPMFPRLNYYMGRAYLLNGDYAYALTAAQEERKSNPNLAEPYLLAAEVYTETKQFQKCAEEYQIAIKLRPQGALLYIKLARCYRQSGSLDIAESMLNIASSQESGNPEIYKEQGAIYETRGDTRSAVAAYNKYLTLSPNAPDRREIESRVYQLSGN
jgi:tetratricopeptide (TPR) repeat protein